MNEINLEDYRNHRCAVPGCPECKYRELLAHLESTFEDVEPTVEDLALEAKRWEARRLGQAVLKRASVVRGGQVHLQGVSGLGAHAGGPPPLHSISRRDRFLR